VIVLSTERTRRARTAAIDVARTTAEDRAYRPFDAPKTAREDLVRVMRRMEWSSAAEIFQAIGVPDYVDDDPNTERNRYTGALSRLSRNGTIERRVVSLFRKGRTLEYRLPRSES
jgi:hypothetical protein